MGWPPQVGELLPRADEAIGVRYKLATYSLAIDHRDGGPKAKGFASILGISITEIDYLEEQIYAAILKAPITELRQNLPYGVNCVIDFPLQGVGPRHEIIANVRTIWLVSGPASPPRLVSALLKP